MTARWSKQNTALIQRDPTLTTIWQNVRGMFRDGKTYEVCSATAL